MALGDPVELNLAIRNALISLASRHVETAVVRFEKRITRIIERLDVLCFDLVGSQRR